VIALVLGVVVLAAALGPWSDAAVDRTLTAHVIQHLALTLMAAPLLVVGGPVVLRALPRRAGRLLVQVAHPLVGWIGLAAVTAGMHLTGFYDFALEHPWAHGLEHAALLAGAVLFWQPVLGRRWRFAVPYLLAVMAVHGAVAAVLLTDDRPRYTHHTLADQHRGAALMWVVGSLVLVAAMVYAAWDWLRAEERRAAAREAYGR
jgi:putative membrane protein